jgi:hypothetical protein
VAAFPVAIPGAGGTLSAPPVGVIPTDKGSLQTPARRCEEVIAALEAYLAGALPLSELIPIASHLEGCLPCMHRLELRRATLVVLTAADGDGDGDRDPARGAELT